MRFKLDIDKAIEASLYVLNKLDGTDFHKLFKILYFAEKEHLAGYGRPITGDIYCAMSNGPVPSFIYDALKFVKGQKDYFRIDRDLKADFDVTSYFVGAKRQSNIQYLSESDMACLDASVEENRNLDFDTLTNKSHDDAWHKGKDQLYTEMSLLDIAEDGGANYEMLKYIKTNIENSKLLG